MNENETKVEVVFRNDLNAKNKLLTFIINKILEDYEELGGLIDGGKPTTREGNDREYNN